MWVSRMRRHSIVAGLAVLFLPFSVGAQQPGSAAAISGRVRSALDSQPLASATVVLDSGAVRTSTDSAGDFKFLSVRTGPHRLRVQKVGFVATSASVQATAGTNAPVSIVVQPVARELTTVTVNGRKLRVLSRYAGIAERVERNHGALFTGEDVRPLDRTRDVLIRLPGVRVNDRSVTFTRCQDTGTLPGVFGGVGKSTAKVQVYIDGTHITSDDDVGSILDSVNPSSVAYIEVYTGVARIPATYLADACAVIAIWTRAY